MNDSYKSYLLKARTLCKNRGVEISAPLILLEYITKKNRASILAHDEQLLSDTEQQEVYALLGRYLEHEPLAYLIENKEFYSRDFYINKNVLIPRPETELLIEHAANYFNTLSKNNTYTFCDIGTGSGCIAISLLCEVQNVQAVAYDISENALAVARKNANTHHVSQRVQFIHSSLNEIKKSNKYDCIISNPPYIPHHEYVNLEKNVKDYEPQVALTSGESGMEIIEELFLFAENNLKSGGLLLIEHGYNQSAQLQKLALKQSIWKHVESIKDYADIERFFLGIRA